MASDDFRGIGAGDVGERATACSSDLGYAAIDEDLAGRDEAAVVGGQEGDDLRNLLVGSRSGKGRYACRVCHPLCGLLELLRLASDEVAGGGGALQFATPCRASGLLF